MARAEGTFLCPRGCVETWSIEGAEAFSWTQRHDCPFVKEVA